VNYDNSLAVTITVTCYSWASSSGDHSFTCGAIYRPPHHKEDKGSTYRSPTKHDTHVIGPGWTLDINRQDSSKRREWAIQRLRRRKVM